MMEIDKVYCGNSAEILKTFEGGCVQACVTSPPYFGLRDYGVDGQIGLEETPEAYVEKLMQVFREVRRVLKDDGTLWLNLGDSYAGSGGAGGDYAPGGLRDGQPTWKSTYKPRGARQVPDGKNQNAGVPEFGVNRKSLPGLKPKDLIGIPWRVAFALQADGWWLRSDIIWHKPNPMPESVTDRPTKSHEYIFLLSKSAQYYYDAEAIKEPAQIWNGQAATFERENGKATELRAPGQTHPSHRPNRTPKEWTFGQEKRKERVSATGGAISGGTGETQSHGTTRNKRSVWTVSTKPYSGAHFATFPSDLILPCILAGSRPGDVVLDPFFGSGTTGQVAQERGRHWVGIELNPAYVELATKRTNAARVSLFA
jgi:DNA modification methylase